MTTTRVEEDAEILRWSDADLVQAGSAGDRSVFVELYRRHAGVARRVARGVAGNDHDAADAASEAFARVFDAITSGRAPAMEFRAYLTAAARNAAIDQLRRARRRVPDDPNRGPDSNDGWPDDGRSAGPGPSETLTAKEDSQLVTAAFRGLPARWQSVLWLTEVEGVPPREAAGVLGLSPNSVAQLAVRARARLRERYLQAHVRNHAGAGCQTTVDHLGAYLAGTLAEGRRSRVEGHLGDCPACRERLAEVEDLGVSLRRALVPIPLLAMGWLRRGSHRKRPVSAAGAERPAGAALATRVTVSVSGSPLFQTLASTPVSALAIVAAGSSSARWVLRGAAAVLAALPLVSGIGAGHGHQPVAVAVASPIQPAAAPATTIAPRPPAAETPAAPAAVDPGTLPVTAHPSTTVAQALGPVIDVFDADGVRVIHSLDNPQASGAPLVFVVVEAQPQWLRVLVPKRPNGSTGWVRRQDVSLSSHAFSIVVELAAHRITAFNGTEPFLSEPAGVGKTDTPTPTGLYYTKELIGPGHPSELIRPGGPYGSYAFGLSGFSDVLTEFGGSDGVVGLHGTNDPEGLGHDISHGCIRLSNEGITTLAQMLPLGVTVDIRA